MAARATMGRCSWWRECAGTRRVVSWPDAHSSVHRRPTPACLTGGRRACSNGAASHVRCGHDFRAVPEALTSESFPLTVFAAIPPDNRPWPPSASRPSVAWPPGRCLRLQLPTDDGLRSTMCATSPLTAPRNACSQSTSTSLTAKPKSRCRHCHGDYAFDRLLRLAADQCARQGVKNIDQLKEVYKEKIETMCKEDAALPTPEALLKSAEKPASSTPPPFTPPPPPPSAQPATKSPTDSKLPPGVKTLSSFIDVEKTLELPEKEIELIWRLRHAQNPQSLCAMMNSGSWNTISRNARRHPQFVLPIPRQSQDGQGAEIHFMQWTFPAENVATVLFTHLAEYQLRNEFASPHTTVTFHTEMAESKGIVLVQGTIVDNRGVSVDEGKWLLMCLQKFYGLQAEEPGSNRKKLLEMFSRGDGGFKVEELLDEAEKI